MKNANRAPKPVTAPTAEKEGVSPADVAADIWGGLRAGGGALYPYRRGLAPTVSIAGLWGLGEILANVPDAWMYSAGAGATIIGASFAEKIARPELIGRVARPVLHWLRENTPGVLWARATVAAGTGWLTAAAALGTDEPKPVALLTGGLILSLPWWYSYRTRIELPKPYQPMPESKPEPVALELEPPADVIWDTRIASTGGPLRGAEVEGWSDIPFGRTTGVWLPDTGSILNEEAQSRTVMITQIYRKRIGEVLIEPHADCIEGHLQFTLLDRAPVEDGRAWAGPNLDALTGIMPIGMFADAKGEAKIRLFEPGAGMKHVLVSGGTGSGKSNLLANLIAAIEHSGVGLTWLADPQGGQSIPDWADETALDRVALDMDEIKVMIRAAYEVMMANSAYITSLEWTDDKGRTRKGKKCMDPTADMPFLALVIDEAHKVLADPEIAKMVADIAKMGRKAGVVLILATQTPTQDELGGTYGGAIRDNVLMGNIIVLRTKSRMTGGMLSLPVDPAKLPAKFANGSNTQGIGFVIGETERPVMMRVDYDDDPYQWVLSSPHTRLHQAAREAAFEVFDNPDQVLGSDGAFAPASLATVLPFPEQTPVETETEKEQRSLARDSILAYLGEHGPAMRGRIIVDLKISAAHVQRVLNDLVERGRLTNDGTGLYAVPGTEVPEEASG